MTETAMTAMDVTDDERSLILQMREWKDGIPEDAVGKVRERAVYVHLIAARAELVKLAVRHGHNDLFHRRDALLGLLSPWVVLELCQAWFWKKDRERDDEEAEMMAGVE